jgi:hypothetical protein
MPAPGRLSAIGGIGTMKFEPTARAAAGVPKGAVIAAASLFRYSALSAWIGSSRDARRAG